MSLDVGSSVRIHPNSTALDRRRQSRSARPSPVESLVESSRVESRRVVNRRQSRAADDVGDTTATEEDGVRVVGRGGHDPNSAGCTRTERDGQDGQR